MTPWQLHVLNWKDCRRCPACEGRRRVVLCRGSLPCDVLFVGEAPGESEDVLGQPFVGPAGQLLDKIIDRTGLPEQGLKTAFTNVVACIPRDPDGGKATEPEYESILACRPRLVELVRLANPRLLVTVGKVAREFTEQEGHLRHRVEFHRRVPTVNIVHPAFILKSNVAARGLMVQRAVVQLADALEAMAEAGAGRPPEPPASPRPKYRDEDIPF